APLSRAPLDYPEIGAAHRASCLESGEEAAAWRRDPGKEEPEKDGSPPAGGSLCQLAPLGELPADSIEEVIRRRGSTRRFARTPIALAQLSTILQTATGGIPADYLEPLGASLNGLYVIAHSVEGLPAGAYFYRGESHALEQLKKGNFRREAGYLDLEQDLAADASANIYCLADLRPVLGRFGNRGYRAAQLEGGILGGRIYLAAYAQRLGATGLTFYDDDVTRFFSPHAEGKSVMFLTAVGRRAKRAVLYQR
ncbi:MAG: SagB/ThcOx family dehydrogenase, partial [Acidobacteriota bacterium]